MVDAPTLATVAATPPAPAVPASDTSSIPGFDKMSFAQQRLAQDQAAAAARTSKQKR
jgi:hypothetical protein